MKYEWDRSKSGQEILFVDGRPTASTRDPLLEARKWLERQRIHSSKRPLCVLGVGSGFHLHALSERFPDAAIVAIELDSRVACEYEQKMSNDSTVRIHVISELKNVFLDSLIQWLIEEGAQFLRFPPAFAGRHQDYWDLFECLVGRRPRPLREWSRSFALRAVEASLSYRQTGDTLTIKDFTEKLSFKAVERTERCALKALRELIK